MKVQGKIEKILLKENNRYSILLKGNWFGGFGGEDLQEGDFVELDYEQKEQWKNIKSIKKTQAPQVQTQQELKVEKRTVISDFDLLKKNAEYSIQLEILLTSGLKLDDGQVLQARLISFQELGLLQRTTRIQEFKQENIKELRK